MNHDIVPLVLLATGGIILTVGDIVMKKWVVTSHSLFYVSGIIIWIAGLLFLAQSFKYKNIAVASTIFVIVNVVTLTLVSWLYFKEKLSVWEIIGIVVGIVAVVILEFAGKE